MPELEGIVPSQLADTFSSIMDTLKSRLPLDRLVAGVTLSACISSSKFVRHNTIGYFIFLMSGLHSSIDDSPQGREKSRH